MLCNMIDDNGYVMGGLSFLLIIPSIILLMGIVDMTHLGESSNIMIKSDNAFLISEDIERNIPIITLNSLKEIDDNVVKTGSPLQNSRNAMKIVIQSKINDFNTNYQKNTGVAVDCHISSVESADDPFEVEVNSSISTLKDNISYNKNISQKVLIAPAQFPKRFIGENNGVNELPDPLPFIKCQKYGGMSVHDGKILYGSSLSKYLTAMGIKDSSAYVNASSPFLLKKCPYEPYISHGNGNKFSVLKNCLENGYYHESHDGACILCRLEGKAICIHHGFETFILPSYNIDKKFLKAPCSIDHVIFSGNEYGNETYPGEVIEYYSTINVSYKIFLDHGHRIKYGLNTF
jgi:hypothetical protein